MKHFDNNLTALDALAWLGSALGTAVIAMLAAVLMAGCSPGTVPYPVETVRYERVEADTSKFMALINSLREEISSKESKKESVIHNEKETVRLNENGDTIFRDRFIYINLQSEEKKEYEHIIASQRDSIDTLNERLASQKTDSIQVPYPVERQLTKWETVKMEAGGWAIGAGSVLLVALVAVVVWLIKIKRRK